MKIFLALILFYSLNNFTQSTGLIDDDETIKTQQKAHEKLFMEMAKSGLKEKKLESSLGLYFEKNGLVCTAGRGFSASYKCGLVDRQASGQKAVEIEKFISKVFPDKNWSMLLDLSCEGEAEQKKCESKYNFPKSLSDSYTVTQKDGSTCKLQDPLFQVKNVNGSGCESERGNYMCLGRISCNGEQSIIGCAPNKETWKCDMTAQECNDDNENIVLVPDDKVDSDIKKYKGTKSSQK